MDWSWVIAVFVGVLQGILEWLPISSEGNISLFLSLFGFSPIDAVHLSLFLHMGTGIAALIYYKKEIYRILVSFKDIDSSNFFSGDTADFSFLFVAVLVSGFVGISVYIFLEEIISGIATSVFIFVIGLLLIFTGVLQWISMSGYGSREIPGFLDSILVGVGQGVALLPGVSRSGTTVSIFLLRGYKEETAFVLSFILAVPASIGASLLAILEGNLSITPTLGFLALISSSIVGYATIELLMKLVESISFWKICIIFGVLTVFGSYLTI